jgi:hypothetical protein
MVRMRRLRLVVANDLLSYREAIATALQRLRPDVDVRVVDPAELADQMVRWRPHMVISSVQVARAGDWPLCWVALYPARTTQVVVNVAGQQTWAADLDLAELLAVVDRTASLVGSRGICTIWCRAKSIVRWTTWLLLTCYGSQ